MNMPKLNAAKFAVLAAALILAITSFVMADGLADTTTSTVVSQPVDTRYGLFGWLDNRSSYGKGVFPEPFLVDDSDLEVNEARLDWLHTLGPQSRNDVVTAEIEKGFGQLTLEIEVPYEVDNDLAAHQTTDGFDNIDVGARYPIYQYVSDNGSIDTTFGVALEVGIPTHSSLSDDTEVVPKVFDDLRLGTHFTLQSIFGYSMLCGGDEDNGLKTFEYGFVFGYAIQHSEPPLPDVRQFIPMFELVGEDQLNHGDAGRNSLTGNAGFRLNLKAIGRVQPRLGAGYVFPIDQNAREDLHWGVITSLVFEY